MIVWALPEPPQLIPPNAKFEGFAFIHNKPEAALSQANGQNDSANAELLAKGVASF